ncbi:MAG: DM13 domain-containing protein [Armatimonadota bacterium]
MRTLMAALILLLAPWAQAAPVAFGAASTQPVFIATGKFAGTDDVHKGEGKALIVQLPTGQRFLRFEEFKVTNGPDLYVYLSGHSSPRNRAQLHDGGAFEIGLLKGNIGNQNYELPATVDPTKYRSVVIYCKRFSVLFASAELVFNR